ncbi:Tyrosine-trna ligase, partial [Globisporangium splendens]
MCRPFPNSECLWSSERQNMSSALAALRARGMLAAMTHQEAGATLDKLLRTQAAATSSSAPPLGVYCGFDPTADSLHLGNLLQGIALRHFQRAGLRPILLVGGATGMIGDPSGKSEERVLLTDDVVAHNASQIIKGLSPVLDFDCPKTGAIICNNAEWHTKMSAVEWMRDIGSVKKRLDSDQGISFLEFSYQLFQAYDFLHLFRTQNCVVQIGGSDQWGNIASGCELVRKSTGDDVFGVTLPLLTNAKGEKYGKSAGNAVWLDAQKTSVFDFYQYFLRADDRDVEQLLKSFTFFSVEEIQELVQEHQKAPERREAQKVLAEAITTTMHGKEGLQSALSATELLFGGKKTTGGELTADQVLQLAGDAPVSTVSRADIIDRSLVDLCVRVGASKSKAECRRLIKGGGLYLNNKKIESEAAIVTSDMLLDGKLLLLRTGRRNNFLVQVQ